MLSRRIPWTSQPPLGTPIDWRHPLLKMFPCTVGRQIGTDWVFEASAGYGFTKASVASTQAIGIGGVSTPLTDAGSLAVTRSTSSAGDKTMIAVVSYAAGPLFSNETSRIVEGYNTSSGGIYCCGIAFTDPGGALLRPHAFTLDSSWSPTRVFSTINVPKAGVHVVAMTYTGATKSVEIFVDGESGGSAIATNPRTADDKIYHRSCAPAYKHAEVHLDGIVPASVLKTLSANPWTIFQP